MCDADLKMLLAQEIWLVRVHVRARDDKAHVIEIYGLGGNEAAAMQMAERWARESGGWREAIACKAEHVGILKWAYGAPLSPEGLLLN